MSDAEFEVRDAELDEFVVVYEGGYGSMAWTAIAQMAAEENERTGHVSRHTAKAYMLRSIDHALTHLDEYMDSPDWPWMEAQHGDLQEIFFRAVRVSLECLEDAYNEIHDKK